MTSVCCIKHNTWNCTACFPDLSNLKTPTNVIALGPPSGSKSNDSQAALSSVTTPSSLSSKFAKSSTQSSASKLETIPMSGPQNSGSAKPGGSGLIYSWSNMPNQLTTTSSPANFPNSYGSASSNFSFNPTPNSQVSGIFSTLSRVSNMVPATNNVVQAHSIPSPAFFQASNNRAPPLNILSPATNIFSAYNPSPASSFSFSSTTNGSNFNARMNINGNGNTLSYGPNLQNRQVFRTTTKKKSSLAEDIAPLPKKFRDNIIDDEVAVKIFRELKVSAEFLNSGKVLAWALQPDDEDFINIHDYVARSQEHGYGVKILSILRIISNVVEAPLSFNEDPATKGMFRMMLWHGTKKRFVTKILENGLKLPKEHGQMFGTGIYFADRISKSCGYTDDGWALVGANILPTSKLESYLLLCDVLLGEMHKSTVALPKTTAPPTTCGWGQGPVEFNSVKGCGINVPDIEWQKEVDRAIWPLGPTVRNTEDKGPLSLNYNEYIVYNPDQVQPKFLVKVQFLPKPVYENLY